MTEVEPFIRPDVRAFLTAVEQSDLPSSRESGAAAARAQMLQSMPIVSRPVGELAVIRDLALPGRGGAIPIRLFDTVSKRPPGPAVVFFHGGGWVIGDLDTHAPFCATMARALDLPVIAVHYRLAPEHRWPAAPDDCEAAARWMAESPEVLDRAVTGLVLAGDSAGGTLTIVTALALRDKPAAQPVLAQMPIYPAVDRGGKFASYARFRTGYMLTDDNMQWFEDLYAADLDHWRGAPILADQTGMPATLVLTASLDPLVDQGRAYAAATIAAGVPTAYREAQGMIHGFINLDKVIPSAQGDIAGALAAFKAMIVEAEGQRIMAEAA